MYYNVTFFKKKNVHTVHLLFRSTVIRIQPYFFCFNNNNRKYKSVYLECQISQGPLLIPLPSASHSRLLRTGPLHVGCAVASAPKKLLPMYVKSREGGSMEPHAITVLVLEIVRT